MAHSNSFSTLIAVSQQPNQTHFQQTAASVSHMQQAAVVNSQIVFPQCQQTLSIPQVQNGTIVTNPQLANLSTKQTQQVQHARQFQQSGQQQQQQFTIPVQLGTTGHAITAAGIPLDLSYLVQGGCIPNCLPIQLTGPTQLQQGFQTAIGCVNTSGADQTPVQADQTAGNSFLQFANVNVAYPSTQQIATFPISSTTDTQTISTKQAPKRKKKNTKKETLPLLERTQSVAVQTDFDMSLCGQQIVVVPPKNCTCGAVERALASGAFQAASFPPGPRKNEKKPRKPLIKSDSSEKDDQTQQHIQNPIDQCNGSVSQPTCDNRGRPFNYECLYCSKKFSLHSRLVAHTRCHTGMRPFSCLQCGYSFTQRSYLNRHAAVHKQERPFSCMACHKTYKHYGSLANHRKLHAKENSDTSSAPPPTTTSTASTSEPPGLSESSGLPMHPQPPITSPVVASTTGSITTQLFHNSSHPVAFYQTGEPQSFMLSFNNPTTGIPPSVATSTVLVQLQPNINSCPPPSSVNTVNAYQPVMQSVNSTSSAF